MKRVWIDWKEIQHIFSLKIHFLLCFHSLLLFGQEKQAIG